MAQESGSGAVFKAIIQAVDRVSEPMAGITAAVKRLAGAEGRAGAEEMKLHAAGIKGTDAHVGAFKRLANHVEGLRGHFANLGGAVRNIAGDIASVLTPLGALGGATSFAGIVAMTNDAADAFSQLKTSAEQAGVSVKMFSALSLAAKNNDIPVENLRNSLFNLNKIIEQAASGKNKNAVSLFQHLGISLKDASGHALTAQQLLPKLADAFERTHNAAMRAEMATVLFGGRSGRLLIPLLDKGSSGLAAYNAEFQKIGYIPSGAGAAGLEKFHHSWIGLQAAVSAFSTQLGTKLAPVLRPIVQDFQNWITANRGWITTDIADAAKKLGKALHHISLKEVISDFKALAAPVRTVFNILGPGPTLVDAASVALGVKLVGAFGAVRKAVLAVSVAAEANPIGLAVAAAVIAGELIYTHWKLIKTFFLGFWKSIKPDWTEATKALGGAVKTISGAFDDVWKDIQPILARIQGAMGWIEKSWVGRKILGAPALQGAPGAPGTHGAGGLPGPAGQSAPKVFAPSSFRAGARMAGVPAAASVHGRVHISASFKNVPRGMHIEARGEGAAADPELQVGYAMPLGYSF